MTTAVMLAGDEPMPPLQLREPVPPAPVPLVREISLYEAWLAVKGLVPAEEGA